MSMIILMASERVTVTLPEELVQDIDRRERNRSKFIQEAIRRELERRRREQLRLSLREPHPETEQTAEFGIRDWAVSDDDGDEDLLDPGVGKTVHWEPGKGWTEVGE